MFYALIAHLSFVERARGFFTHSSCDGRITSFAISAYSPSFKKRLKDFFTRRSSPEWNVKIADAVVTKQKRGEKIVTTKDLQRVIEEALSFLPKGEQKEAVKKSCQRTFQALRIDVNQEYEVLYEFLEKLPGVLAPGGRVAILTFHSGEDRRYF